MSQLSGVFSAACNSAILCLVFYKFNNLITIIRLNRAVFYINQLVSAGFIISCNNSFRVFCLRDRVLNLVPVFFYLGAWNNLSDFGNLSENIPHSIFNDLFFELELSFVINELQLACSADFLHGAKWLNPVF